MENDDVELHASENNATELDDIKKRLKEMEDEIAALREMLQATVEKKMDLWDIKGASILVGPNGSIKLADFGIAKHISGQSFAMFLSKEVPTG